MAHVGGGPLSGPSRGKNLTRARPVQMGGFPGRYPVRFRSILGAKRAIWRTKAREVAAPESVGMSTCANLSVAQVAFSTGFSLPRPPRRSFLGAICRNIDLCKPLSCTSRISNRLFLPTLAAARQSRVSRFRLALPRRQAELTVSRSRYCPSIMKHLGEHFLRYCVER